MKKIFRYITSIKCIIFLLVGNMGKCVEFTIIEYKRDIFLVIKKSSSMICDVDCESKIKRI